jgi:predicted NBD/HSP70 family sugar kinase
MSSDACLEVAEALMLYGPGTGKERHNRAALLRHAKLPDPTFRTAAKAIGGGRPLGLGFFDSRVRGTLCFGPGAGLAVGVSLGTQSLRAAVVDANGWLRATVESPHSVEQLNAAPDVVLNRIRAVVSDVLDRAFANPELLVDGCLPLLGWAVAWPTPIDRDGKPRGQALSHRGWSAGDSLDRRIQRLLGVADVESFALNDSHAAAMSVMHDQTHERHYVDWTSPRLGIVLRIAGGIGGAIVIVEPPTKQDSQIRTGFLRSILIAGYDNHAGEIGHVPVVKALVQARNRNRPEGLGPLTPFACSCAAGEAVPEHVEAYAGALALAARLGKSRSISDVQEEIRTSGRDPKHIRALEDVGVLVAEALVNPVAMLNPATITLTGALALPEVRTEIDARLAREPRFGSTPEVVALSGDANTYARARGAALALIRHACHRRLPELLDASSKQRLKNIQGLTTRVEANPLL